MLTFLPHIKKASSWLIVFGLCFILFGLFAFVLSLSNLFFAPLIFIGALLACAVALYSIFQFFKQSRLDSKIALLLSLLATTLIHSFSVPTIFSGRDQGSIAETALRLAHNGHLAFSSAASESFFHLYGPGTALNFPGFAYTQSGELITQFPLGYPAWLASFVSLFGTSGLVIGNALLFFLFLITFYALLRHFAHPFYAFAGLILAVCSFLPSWFTKITLSENLALFLFVFLLWNLALFLRERNILSYGGVLLSGAWLAFTRIEGFAFLLLTLLVLASNEFTRIMWKNAPWKSILLPSLVFFLLLVRNLFINLPYYKTIGKALIKFLYQFEPASMFQEVSHAGSSFTLGSVFWLYGLLILFIAGIFGMLICIKERRAQALLPAFIALPTFIYLVAPNITLDHPWLLRRFLFSLFPTLLFSAIIGLGLLFSKEKMLPLKMPQGLRLFFVSSLLLVLLVIELPAWSYALPFAENRGLEKQVTDFSQEFSSTDLILVDRGATGDPFAMLSGPAQALLGKNMVYFFNPNDLAKLDLSAFSHVYLLVPSIAQDRYIATLGERLTFKKTVAFSSERFETLSLLPNAIKPLHLPEKIITKTLNSLFEIK